MCTIPIQNLIIDDDTDIGLSADLIIGSFKTTSYKSTEIGSYQLEKSQ
jgi:hypothetical protein